MASARARHHVAVTAVQFNYATHRDPLIGRLDNISGLVAEFAQDELREIAALTATIELLKKRITTEIRVYAPSLLALDGCGVLRTAKIAGKVGNVTRFKSEAALARYIGVAPLPHVSGSTAGHLRASRSGNRNLNAALHRIALIQIRQGGPGRPYYLKRQESGDSAMTALRCLKRRLVRVIYNRLQVDHRARANACG